MKILISGFDPFGGEAINPAFEAVKLLPRKIGGADISIVEVPTVFRKCAEVLKAAIDEIKPDAVLCIGQAGGRSVISVEKVAINLQEARIADNEKNQPIGETIKEDGPAAYFATLPVKVMVNKIKEEKIPSSISYTAGTYVCNDIMYHLLYMIDKEYPNIRGGFIHVPFDTAQVLDKPDGTPSMPVATIAKALECAVKAIATHKEDIHEAAGTTH
ncbi:MAG: pyroglutamyl-peptidase I [Oscillospiraceae bacterium]|nr:pyroglutamyl-peptidase I [Oscillospiraceae bacterium]